MTFDRKLKYHATNITVYHAGQQNILVQIQIIEINISLVFGKKNRCFRELIVFVHISAKESQKSRFSDIELM